jgi:predicted AAA+ superfamily ATPase
MVRGYAEYFDLGVETALLDARAIEWAQTRGARSGRVAWQFIQELAGRLGVTLKDD